MTALDLSTNDLTAADLAQAFRGIPATVTTLNLSGNHLNEKNTAALAQIRCLCALSAASAIELIAQV